MIELKYITTKQGHVILWPRTDSIWHSHIARAVIGGAKSAGFVSIVDGVVSTFGRSESLNLDRADGDDKLIASQLGLDVYRTIKN